MKTDEQLADAFKQGQSCCSGDPEGMHSDGDNFVAQVLRDLGYPLLAAAYEKAQDNWWYS